MKSKAGKKDSRPRKVCLLAAVFMMFTFYSGSAMKAYSAGDYGYIGIGAWSVTANWYIYDGVSWVSSAGLLPTTLTDVYILSGDSVIVDAGGKDCKSLYVEGGAKLLADPGLPNNFYINVYGKEITNNGIVGSSVVGAFNGISFNVDGDTTVISSDSINVVNPADIPLFTCSRMRKLNLSTTTNLFIGMDIYMTFFTGSFTQLYNGKTGSIFNVTINKNITVTIGNAVGGVCVNGIQGVTGGTAGGTFTIKGRLDIQGVLYLRTASTTNPAAIIIDSTGVINTFKIDTQNSGSAKHTLTIRAGGRLELTGTGTTWSAIISPLFAGLNNLYNLQYNSNVVYAASGPQTIANAVAYSNLILNSSPAAGPRTMATSPGSPLTIFKDLIIQNRAQLSPVGNTVTVGGNFYADNDTLLKAGTGQFIFNGFDGTQQTITTLTANGKLAFNNLRIANPSFGLKLNVPVTVGSVLDLTNSPFYLNAKSITLNNTAAGAITRTTGYIVSEDTLNLGKIRWYMANVMGAHVFPFGTTAGLYIPVTYTGVSGTPDTVTVSTYPTAADNTPWPTQPVAVTNLLSSTGLLPDNRSATVKRFWQVDPIGSSPVATVALTYAPAELPDSTGPYKIQRWPGPVASPKWVLAFPSQTTSGNTITAPSISAFGALTMASVLSPLPINLLSFSAEPKGNVVLTKWTTASETDNDFFTVERMNSKGEIEKRGRVNGAGSSNMLREYNFIDRSPITGQSYYRITQMDYNGKSESFKWVAVSFERKQQSLILYPNPANGEAVYLLNTEDEIMDLTYKIIDIKGQEVGAGQLNSTNHISVKELSKGMYFFIFSAMKKDPVALSFVKN